MLRMGDGPVANLPAGLDAYAGYADKSGIGVTYPAVVAAFPGKIHFSISVHGLAPAQCGDVENGALSSWAGYDYGYGAVSQVGTYILQFGRPKRLWAAHYGVGPHICTSQTCWPSSPVTWIADGTQWTDHGGVWDESLLNDNFFLTTPAPPAPPAPAPGPVPAKRKRKPMSFVAYDSKGNQWLIVPGVGRYGIPDPTTSASMCAACGQAKPLQVADTFLTNFPIVT